MTFVLIPGQRHEATKLEALMEQGVVKRVGRGCPKLRPKRVLGDKAYRSCKIRRYLKHRGIGYTIPRRSDKTRTGPLLCSGYDLQTRLSPSRNWRWLCW